MFEVHCGVVAAAEDALAELAVDAAVVAAALLRVLLAGLIRGRARVVGAGRAEVRAELVRCV